MHIHISVNDHLSDDPRLVSFTSIFFL